jgi:hypothetical protein
MKNPRGTLFFLVLVTFVGLTALTQSNCGGDDDGAPGIVIVTPQPDTIPPSTVANLRTDAHTYQSMALVWSAPGNDRTEGTAANYDIRYSTKMIINDEWDSATPINSNRIPTPKPAGSIETIVILGLDSNTKYYFALKASDEEGNESSLSNCCNGLTEAEEFPPADITDLYAVAVSETSFELTWTASGDDYVTGTAAKYDIRYSIRPIENETHWNAATPIADTPAPKPAGENESFVATVAFYQNYFFALKVADELDNWSGISNMTAGLKLGEILWIYPASIAVGATMYVVFKGSETAVTRISLQQPSYWWEDVTCGDGVVEDLFWNSLPGEVHMVRFKFWDETNQEYYPTASYYMSICYGPVMQLYKYVSLYN